VSGADEDYAFGLYPDGSKVLRNKLGLRDAADLRIAEYQATTDRERDAPVFPATREGYQGRCCRDPAGGAAGLADVGGLLLP